MKCILAIDDDENFLKLIHKGLSDRGYEVHTIADPRVGLGKAEELQPDCIVLDCVMPDLSGVDTLQMLKANPIIWKIPVIMLTGYTEPHHVIHSMQSGAAAFVTKNARSFSLTLDKLEEEFKNIDQA